MVQRGYECAMKRRQILKGIAASGLVSVGAGTASGMQTASRISVGQLDALHVERNGETVAVVENPTQAEFDRLDAELAEDERLVTPDGCCASKCKYDCPTDCDCCAYQCVCWSCEDGTKVCDSSNC